MLEPRRFLQPHLNKYIELLFLELGGIANDNVQLFAILCARQFTQERGMTEEAPDPQARSAEEGSTETRPRTRR